MVPLKPLALLLLAAASVPAQTPPPEVISQLPGGLKGEIIMLAKNRGTLSMVLLQKKCNATGPTMKRTRPDVSAGGFAGLNTHFTSGSA
jgi:hypothetical protein